MGFFSELFGLSGGNLQLKIGSREKIPDTDFYVKKIFAKGQILFSSDYGSHASYRLLLQDSESEQFIISNAEFFQISSQNPTYMMEEDLGYVNGGAYWTDWVQLGVIPDSDVLASPYKGNRDINVLLHVVDTNGNIVGGAKEQIKINFTEYGYAELNKDRLNTQKAAIKLACIIAGSDGNLQKSELKIIKDFAKETVDFAIDEDKNQIKKGLNSAIDSGIKQGKKIAKSTTKRVNTTAITKKVKEIASDRDKKELLDLCLKVMAGDGAADINELKILEKIATEIGIDYNDYQNEKDKFMIGLDVLSNSDDSSDIGAMEKMMGIKSDWSVKRKLDHLKKEFRKWNSRSGSLGDKKKEQNVQKMLDVIAKLRQHYKNKN
tara:strand:- start:2556 stop:3686 length:1131 start_codon:yes stop_codon:yes gene_type:complete